MADAEDIPVGADPSIEKPTRRRPPRWTTTITCLSCQREVPQTGAMQKRCGPCSREFRLAKKRQEGAAKTGASYVPLSMPKPCKFCGQSFVRTCGTQKLCDNCRGKTKDATLAKSALDYREARRNQARLRTGANYHKNREAILASRKTEEYRSLRRADSRKRYASNPRYSLINSMSCGIRRSLVTGKQGRSWKTMVPYTLDDLFRHLERQFLPGMTWANRGEWEIDHIVPLSSFRFSAPEDAEFQAAWALTNLRPLWRPDNRSKYTRRVLLL